MISTCSLWFISRSKLETLEEVHELPSTAPGGAEAWERFVSTCQAVFSGCSRLSPSKLQSYLPADVVVGILKKTQALCSKEPTLVEIRPGEAALPPEVVVVGDTHGQYHDVLRMMEVAGPPSTERLFVINGDMVDRGSWGLETLLTFCLLKLARAVADDEASVSGTAGLGTGNVRGCPGVTILRGNHETATCSIMYGFKLEVEAKYGKIAGRTIFSACKQLFKHLPLAALVNDCTLVLHGGLFRKRRGKKRAQRSRKGRKSKKGSHEDEDFVLDEGDPVLGSLRDLRSGSKGGLDATGIGEAQLAADVLWSDPAPMNQPGFEENYARGIGMVFGPDITEAFLVDNRLKLIIRSHEGPDARESRPYMPNMLEGYSTDHETPSGKLMTVFSAPDYPQHLPEDVNRYHNKASVFVLRAETGYSMPEVRQFEAVLPRPVTSPYYDLGVPDSDEEIDLLPSTASGMTDVTILTEEDQVEVAQPAVENGVDLSMPAGTPKRR